SANRVTETRYPDGAVEQAAYDDAGNRVSETDALGRTTHYDYDTVNRLVETSFPDATPADLTDNPRRKIEYDEAGQVAAEIAERGNRTEFDYDEAGRLRLQRDALGREWKAAYDAAGRTVSTTDPLNHTTTYVYDALGRQVEAHHADGTVERMGYD